MECTNKPCEVLAYTYPKQVLLPRLRLFFMKQMRDNPCRLGRLFYRDLSSFDGSDVGTMGKVVKLVDNFDSLYQYVTNEGRTFWFRSNMDAPKYKVRMRTASRSRYMG